MKDYLTLRVRSTSKEKDLEPFWNDACQANVSKLYAPTKTDLQGWDSNSYSGSSNDQEALSKSWIKRKMIKDSTPTFLCHSSLASSIPTMESEVQIVTRKIRIYPENESKFWDLSNFSRAIYNRMVAIKKDYKTYTEKTNFYRTQMLPEVKEWNSYQSHVYQEAIRNADITATSIIKRRMRGEQCDFSFRSKHDSVQGFDIQKLGKAIYPRFVGKTHFTEPIPEYAIGRTARVINENGEWYICCLDVKQTSSCRVHNSSRVCALDPGIRTLQTLYSPDEVSEMGADFFKDKIMPLLIKLDKLIGKRQVQKNKGLDNQRNNDLFAHYNKKINKLRSRIKNFIEDLHYKCANYLTNEFDIILLPTFETKGMVSKIGGRKIRTKTVRGMLGLSHYKFKERLKWIARKKGAVVLDVSEAYTSKTNGFTGEIMNIGSSKTYKHKGRVYDRDVMGARNIFIKNTLV